MCKLAGETTDFLLLHGLVAQELWSMVFIFVWDPLGYVKGCGEAFCKLARQDW